MSNNWIEHNGGPQPVGDDVWVEAQWPFSYFCAEGRYFSGEPDEMEQASELPWEGNKLRYRILNDHLIDAARLEGIRLGLDAAATTVCRLEIEAAPEAGVGIDSLEWGRFAGLAQATDLIRALNPDAIAKEAQRD